MQQRTGKCPNPILGIAPLPSWKGLGSGVIKATSAPPTPAGLKQGGFDISHLVTSLPLLKDSRFLYFCCEY